MTIKELIHKLSKYHPELEITNSDGDSITHLQYLENAKCIALYATSKVKD